MATLQERNGSFRILFFHHGKQRAFTIGKVSRDEADKKVNQVEYLLMRIKQRLLVVPDGVDIVTFVEHDGNPPKHGPVLQETRSKVVTLGHLRDRYLHTFANGTIEANSLETARLHLTHVVRFLGELFPLNELSLSKLQEYVDHRAELRLSTVTIRKETATLRASWNWGEQMGLTSGKFPGGGLRYPKHDEKPPFMTMAEIERRLASGGEAEKLWESLYLQSHEIKELLEGVKARASHPWIYPLFVFVAHTGARRSEILRAMLEDIDFAANAVLIREKKRSRGKRTTRRVPLTPFLKEVLQEWLAIHPGGPFLFCHTACVARSKKRSSTTGHRSGKSRPSSTAERQTTVRNREQVASGALTPDEVHDHFKRVLAETKWRHMRGFHTLRHSFISACASKGVDQRLVQEWAGHMNEATSKRYRHLYPSTQQEAIKGVFE